MDLIIYPDKILETPTEKVTVFDGELREQSKVMFEIMRKNKGIGLAANQVGLKKRMFVMDVETEDGGRETYTIINPVVRNYGDLFGKRRKMRQNEGCLSFPKIEISVERDIEIYLDFQTKDGELLEGVHFFGLAAVCAQHEMDHLDGKTFLDYTTKIKKAMVIKHLERLKKK